MAYLNHDSNTIIVDAVLTKKGRELLSKGSGQFSITKFAVADDEVDYGLWDPDHISGSNYYGEVIENLPLLEASVNETKSMRYKLVSLDKEQLYLSYIEDIPDQTMSSTQGPITIVPVTSTGFDNTLGYTMTFENSDVCTVVGSGLDIPTAPADGARTSTSITAVGKSFLIYPIVQQTADATVNVTVIGNATGATLSFTVTVSQYEATQQA